MLGQQATDWDSSQLLASLKAVLKEGRLALANWLREVRVRVRVRVRELLLVLPDCSFDSLAEFPASLVLAYELVLVSVLVLVLVLVLVSVLVLVLMSM